MTLSAKDIASLGRPLFVLALFVMLAVAGVLYTGKLVNRSKVALAVAEAKLTDARKLVFQSGDEMRTLKQFIEPYRLLEQRGVVGEEQRLGWVDALRAANIDARIYGVEYEVGVQTPYAFTQEVGAGSLPVFQSVMKVRLGLLYETDLINFFTYLASQQVGTFWVNRCALQRIQPGNFKPANRAMLRAECDVAWITIATPAGSERRS